VAHHAPVVRLRYEPDKQQGKRLGPVRGLVSAPQPWRDSGRRRIIETAQRSRTEHTMIGETFDTLDLHRHWGTFLQTVSWAHFVTLTTTDIVSTDRLRLGAYRDGQPGILPGALGDARGAPPHERPALVAAVLRSPPKVPRSPAATEHSLTAGLPACADSIARQPLTPGA